MSTSPRLNWAQAADALVRILEAENEALRATDFAAAGAFLPAKRAAIDAVEKIIPKGLEQPPRETIRHLDLLASENRKLLNRSITIQSQVLSIIAGAARSASVFGYGSSGKSANRGGAFALSAKA